MEDGSNLSDWLDHSEQADRNQGSLGGGGCGIVSSVLRVSAIGKQAEVLADHRDHGAIDITGSPEGARDHSEVGLSVEPWAVLTLKAAAKQAIQ